MAQGLSTPDPSLSPTHLSIRRGRATTTHYTQYTHRQVSLMVSRNTTLVPSLGYALGQPVRQASALAREGSVCHPKDKDKNKCVSRTDTNPPFAFQTAFPRGTDFSVPTGRVKKLHTLFVSLYF